MGEKVIGCTPYHWKTISRLAIDNRDYFNRLDVWDWEKISNNTRPSLILNDENHLIYKNTKKSPNVNDLEKMCSKLYNVIFKI